MALPQFGTQTTFDALASTQQTIAQFGEDHAWDGIASMLNSYNDQQAELTSSLVDRTTSRLRRYGTAAQMEMQRLDEMGTPNVQKVQPGVPVGFPLENYGIALQWTRTFMKTTKASVLASQILAATTADTRRMIRNIKVAIYTGINYNFVDYLVDHLEVIPLPVKAFLNADGQPVPPGPNGEVYNGYTHTHYLASATLTNAFAASVVETVIEHYNEGEAVIWINRADETAWRALVDFKAMTYDYVIRATTQEYGEGTLNKDRLYNRQIGYFRGAEVWTKPYAIAGYMFCYMDGAPQPLVMRIRGEEANGGAPLEDSGNFVLTYEDDLHPLRAKAYEHEYGIGVWNRTNGSVGYYGGSVYVQPVIS